MTEAADTPPADSPSAKAPAQPVPPSAYPPYDPSADDKLLYTVAAVVVAAPLLALGLLALASKGSKAPFRFSASGLLDKEAFDDYLTKGSFRTRATVKFKHPVEKVWPVFAGEGAWSWIPFVKGVHYVGVPGEGAVRYLKTLPLAVGEQVVEWDEGKTLSYTGTGASLPLLKQLASKYTFEPTKKGGTRFVWDLAATPKLIGFLPLRWAALFVKPLLMFGAKRANSTIRSADS